MTPANARQISDHLKQLYPDAYRPMLHHSVVLSMIASRDDLTETQRHTLLHTLEREEQQSVEAFEREHLNREIA
ncbi:hypothetical protein EJ069_10380 [Mesorhizobium sp. M2A.F.Ca.ET.043.05.1.1]|uniref:hypothetical protein n=1 Tax=Mesorhizobium sp. M2A.F.Ca.ET.043.05.1.1 TaxID=2493671 RepID=UPI000F74D3B6|nr:hypothetical protein [Mesorhizobium sp. M2A.F.Ca.ET.043.05.1.1]AZO15101.1 hypothetical protein EJ069_10380 [Mesorhizobium sp. M2A.F.Ca.ET.043.05.1.1]